MLELIHVWHTRHGVEDDDVVEGMLHKHFRSRRYHGEWFSVMPSEIIATVTEWSASDYEGICARLDGCKTYYEEVP